jgi:exodeoxyribonuclease X
MATHHIIESDLKDSPAWSDQVVSFRSMSAGYLVGHNIDFDWKAIGSPDIKRICTLALARSVFPDLDSHSLSALTYHQYPHGMARELLKNAHSAGADVDLTYRLLYFLYDAVGRPATWEELWRISEKARIPTRFSFGKYGPKDGKKGALISEVLRSDRGYVKWCLANADIVKESPYWQKALTA